MEHETEYTILEIRDSLERQFGKKPLHCNSTLRTIEFLDLVFEGGIWPIWVDHEVRRCCDIDPLAVYEPHTCTGGEHCPLIKAMKNWGDGVREYISSLRRSGLRLEPLV